MESPDSFRNLGTNLEGHENVFLLCTDVDDISVCKTHTNTLIHLCKVFKLFKKLGNTSLHVNPERERERLGKSITSFGNV